MMSEAIAELAKRPPDPGRVLHLASKDVNGRRLVLREHEFGMSRSLLEYRPEEYRWRTLQHAVRMFK